MSYQFKPSLGVQANLRRVAAGQIANAIAELDDPGLDQAKLVHQLRRRCKKLRGLIRLVAPAMGKAYAVENAHLRDAARRLSSSRDAQVMLETHDALIAPPAAPADAIDFASVRQQLQARLNQSSTTETEEQLSGFRSDMLAMKPRAKEWQVSGKGFSAIACGLQKTHHQATRSLQDAISRPSEESFHQLRKQVKYHGYQLRLLRPLWIDMFVTYEQLCSALSELLGDDHNLQVLRSRYLKRHKDLAVKTA